jgi:hypothetical protein
MIEMIAGPSMRTSSRAIKTVPRIRDGVPLFMAALYSQTKAPGPDLGR